MTLRGRWVLALVVVVAALAVAGPAAAINPVLADPTPGVTGPMGIFRDSHDQLWVADSHAGICRLEMGAHDPGAGMIPSPYCDPAAVLANRPGPAAPGQSAFDIATGNIYVGDGASGSGGVWRMHIDQSGPGPWEIDAAVKIYDVSGIDRVFAMAFHPGLKRLDFSTKNSPNILRIDDPATCPPSSALNPCTVGVAGSAEVDATSSLIHDAVGNIYIADLSGVTKITEGSQDTQARPVPGLNIGTYTAMAFDEDNNRILAGTTNPEGVDWIDILDLSSQKTGTYSVGFDGITAIGVDLMSPMHSGRLDVVDDPGIKQLGEDLGGTGRRFLVDYEQFIPPPVIESGPQPIVNVRVANFFFSNASPTTFYCSLDLAPATACGTGTGGTITYSGLTSGAHTFVLYSNDPNIGPRTIRRFAIDTRAPVSSIDTTTIAGSFVEFGLSSDDLNVNFTCRMDSGPSASCDNPARFAGLADGVHTFTVYATDLVGNVGPPVGTTFRIGPLPDPPWKAGAVTATLRGTTLRVVFNTPPSVKIARVTLAKTNGFKLVKLVGVKAGSKNTVIIKLTRAQAERLQRRTVTVRIVAGPTKSALTTKAGSGTLKITARLPKTKAR